MMGTAGVPVDSDTVESQQTAGGRRKALIIANNEYDDEALGNLRAPQADAEALARVLGDPLIGGFSVEVISNQPSGAVKRRIDDLFSECQPDDMLLLYFSGHGLKNDAGKLYLATKDTLTRRLPSTAVEARFVQEHMRDTRSRGVVLLLDCCYSGAFGEGVEVKAGGDVNVLGNFAKEWPDDGRGRAVITASNALEYAFEGGRLAGNWQRGPSVFTGVVVEGLETGDADLNADTLISVDDLYDYVSKKVPQRNPHQTPSLKNDLTGDLYIARSRRLRIRPAPIPADLQEQLDTGNMYTRVGVVRELESRVTRPELPVAAGAYRALVGIVRDDIEYVANVAAPVVLRASVRPEEDHIDFGTQPQGAEPAHRVIRLLGPPIARACASKPSDEWVKVTEVRADEILEELDIWLDTTSAGTFHGKITLEGTTGPAEITVAGEVGPPVGPPVVPALVTLLPWRSSAGGRRVLAAALSAAVLLVVIALAAAFLPGLLSKNSADGRGPTGSGPSSPPASTARPTSTPTTPAVPAVPAADCATGSLILAGGALGPIANAAASVYQSECPGAEIKVNPVKTSNSAYGVDQLVSDAKRDPAKAASEISMYDGITTDATGLTPDPVGLIVYSVVAHTGALPGSAISITQLQKLYTPGIGLSGKTGVSLPSGSGSRQALLMLWHLPASAPEVSTKTCQAGRTPPSQQGCIASDYGDAMAFVDSTQNGIAYMAVDRITSGGHPSINVNGQYTSDPHTSVISIQTSGTSTKGVLPTVQNAINGAYPYVALEHLYLPPNQSKLSKGFVKYLHLYVDSVSFNDFAACPDVPRLAAQCAASS